ncbi:MAG: DUF3306 domain-containing protein [Natronohydrobacter sp.]|nr:DUF3306 domain-containing protein [Natronohydrobacter sp.]
MAQPPDDESFLARWSKRKRAEAVEPAPEPAPEPPAPPEVDDSISEEELAALPALEDFTPHTDIRPFLRKGVPNTLRNAALRKIWLLTPAIRDHKDPAVDYAWDWNTPGGVPGDGAAPTPERAAQMLRDLITPRRSAEDEMTLETRENMPPELAAEAERAAVQNPPSDATDQTVAPLSEESATVKAVTSKTKENQSTNEPDTPRRRHGGALPS